jgi:hypothetical protein
VYGRTLIKCTGAEWHDCDWIPLAHDTNQWRDLVNMVLTADICLLGCCACQILLSLMMEAVITSETPVNFYQSTWNNNPIDGYLHTHCREKLKSHTVFNLQVP